MNWIGVDLDATLAFHGDLDNLDTIGAPIPKMVERVKRWLAEGRVVKIFTARVGIPEGLSLQEFDAWSANATRQRWLIRQWCEKHLGESLPVTAQKDLNMVSLWDDRAVQMIPNTGLRADGAAL